MPSSYHITIFSFFLSTSVLSSRPRNQPASQSASQSVSQSVSPSSLLLHARVLSIFLCVSRASCVVVLLLLHWSHQIKNDASFNLIICILSLSLSPSRSVSNKSHLKLKTRARFSRHFAPVPSGSSSTG